MAERKNVSDSGGFMLPVPVISSEFRSSSAFVSNTRPENRLPITKERLYPSGTCVKNR